MRPINLIVYLKLVKYTNLVQSYTWPHFQFIVLLNLMFTMLSTQISYKYHIYAQCRLRRATHKPYSIFEIYHVKYTNLVQS